MGSRNAITEKKLSDGEYAELEKEYRDSQAERDKLQDELTGRRRKSLMIKRFIEEVKGFDDVFTEFSENLWLGLVDDGCGGQEEFQVEVQERDGSTG